jgi:DNA-3-methyladenine glycosylase
LKLPTSFYLRDDVVEISRDLLGKVLCTRIDGFLTRATITETEAYAGTTDKGSHAYGGRRTRRTEPLYAAGGIAYVYLCYGIHHLFNVVTNISGTPHAVLVRAGVPVQGAKHMLARRGKEVPDDKLLGGPGSLARALGITTRDTGVSLVGRRVWIEDARHENTDKIIIAGPRIGIDYAGEDAARPYRFVMSPRQ